MFYIVSTNIQTQSKHFEKSGRTFIYDENYAEPSFGYERKGTAKGIMTRLKNENDAWCIRHGERGEHDRCTYTIEER